MVVSAVRSLLAEPRAPNPPARVWRDWVLVAALLTSAVLETIFREDVVWRPFALAYSVGLMVTLLWRRTHPLAMLAISFGVAITVGIAEIITGSEPIGLNTTVFIILLPYAVFRWGSGREAAIGLAIMLVAYVVGVTADYTGVVESALGFAFLLLPATIGASVRYATSAHLREKDQARLREREQLARELHDTVAHHVSAIAIRAQAGRVVAASRPDAAVDALQVIEQEASRTLAELRTIVGVLRQGEEPELAPQPGVADIRRLAHAGDVPRVDVQLSGHLDDIGPSVSAAIYRIAQESITNAMRHARQATRIDVRVAGYDDHVRLTVHDDGDASAWSSATGYGLLGMSERATLLGGTLEAGPGGSAEGWTVNVVLPKAGSPA